jgi:hypothetical protein
MNPDLENALPFDHHIEEFWINFKQSMINFYTITKMPPRPIVLWSNNLNVLQKAQNYDMIEKTIRDYISLYAIDVLRHYANYYFCILHTNIKRWNIISTKYNFLNGDTHHYHNVVFMLIDIYYGITVKGTQMDDMIKEIFSMVEIYIINNDFMPLITYAIDYNKPSVIDKLNQYTKINNIIETKYNITLSPKTAGRKIISLIRNEK